jgi:uncharacterized protein
MLISLSVANFRSFSEEQTFSLVASSLISGDHETHARNIPLSKERVLQAAVLYGANGGGKSNLFKALRFVKSRALSTRKKGRGTGREAFALGDELHKPSRFDLQFIANEKVYRFGFHADDTRISKEWLVEIKGAKERVVYERITNEDGTVTIEVPKKTGKKVEALATVGGLPNQTFLSTVNATLDDKEFGVDFSAVLRWFRQDLVLVGPTDSFKALGHRLSEDGAFLNFAGDYLRASSTGVDALDVEKAEITEDELRALLGRDDADKVLEDLKSNDDDIAILRLSDGNEVLVEKTLENHFYRISAKAVHKREGGSSISFDLKQESDGTRRLLNLLPALYRLSTNSAVFFIDEIDRSMHPILVWKFLEFFLKSCEGGRRQIIVTTHESNLLDLKLIRRDEVWFVEKDTGGSTRLHSLVDFKVRKDLEVRKHYLQGRFGAIPFLGNLDHLTVEDGGCE